MSKHETEDRAISIITDRKTGIMNLLLFIG
jgi:hypothetical protein